VATAARSMGQLFRKCLTSATAAPVARLASAAATGLIFTYQDNLKVDLLEAKLIPGASEELHSSLRRLGSGTQFDANRLPYEMGEVFLHLSIQDEGDIGIKLFLKLEKLAFPVFPGARLKHGED